MATIFRKVDRGRLIYVKKQQLKLRTVGWSRFTYLAYEVFCLFLGRVRGGRYIKCQTEKHKHLQF